MGVERQSAASAEMDASRLQRLLDGLADHGDRTLIQAWGRDRPDCWSYADVGASIARLALGLRRDLEPAEPVVVFAPESPEWLVAALAVVRAGGIVVPLDLQAAGDTLAGMLSDCGARCAFTTSRHAATLREARETLRLILLDEPAEDDEQSDPHWRSLEDGRGALPVLHDDDTAVLFYTSGTTGPPKGVPLSHANIGYQLDTLKDSGIVEADDRVLLPLPLHHVYPLVVGVLTPLHLGLTLILPHALTGQALARAIRDGEASVVIGVPKLYQALYDALVSRIDSAPAPARHPLRAVLRASAGVQKRFDASPGRWLLAPVRHRLGARLRVLASGGAPLDEGLARHLEALGWQVASGYGLTETSPLLTINPPGSGRLGSVGRAAPGTELRCDRSALEQDGSADGRDGEIQARGPGVFSGYHRRDDKTREAFTDDGWYRTGDLGYPDDDGFWHVTGRLSTLLVTESGENLQPDELEQRYADHPAIEEIGVLSRNGRLVGVAVPADDAETVRDAVTEVAGGLPSHQRLADCAISRRPLPRTRLGKLMRHRLDARFDEAAGDGDGDTSAAPQAPEDMNPDDRTLLEEPAARATWRCLAERFPESALTPDSDPRLDLGIESMDWIEITLDIGERAGVELDERAIERVETVRDLLQEAIDAGTAEGVSSPLENPRETLSRDQQHWLRQRSPLLRGIARGLHAVNGWLVRPLFRLEVRGRELLPDGHGYVVIANHASYLDPFALAAALPYSRMRSLFWGGWTGQAFSSAPRRFVSRAAQVVPIDPAGGARSSLALAAVVLEPDYGLIWFPEGERSADGELRGFRPGIGLLLEHFPRTVVVATIRGSRDALPPGRRWPRRRPIEVTFADVAEAEQLEAEGSGDSASERILDALERRLRRALHR